MAYVCPKCSEEFYDRLRFCPKCGFDFSAHQKRCPKCRAIVPLKAESCPDCGLNFEQYAFLLPKIVVFGLTGIVLAFALTIPFIWKFSPWLHDKGVICDGMLRSGSQVSAQVPLFLEWKSGERYIVEARKNAGVETSTEYMDNLIPLPPSVIFHYDVPVGERVWIIGRTRIGANRWIYIGRWSKNPHGRFGWIHSSNMNAAE